jgi:ABC-2 type transport system permease protein
MRNTVLVAFGEVALRVRDRSALVAAFLAPVLLALVTTAAFGDLEAGERVRLLVAHEGSGAVGDSVLEGLREALPADRFDVEAIGDVDEVRERVRRGEADGGLVLPPETTQAVLGVGEARITVIEAAAGSAEGEVARTVARAVAARLEGARLGLAAAAALKAAPVDLERAAAALAGEAGGVERVVLEAAPSLAAFFGPSMAIVFAVFAVGAVVQSAWSELRGGTWARLVVATGSSRSVLAGKAAAAVLFGTASMVFVWATTVLVFGAGWGPPLGVLLLVVATVAAATGVTVLVASFARNEEHLQGAVAAVGFGFALLGGNFLPPGQTPSWLERLSLAVPNGWSLEGFRLLSLADGSAVDALAPTAVLLLFAGACLALAARRPLGSAT